MPASCTLCRSAKPLGFAFTMAFQPIVDVVSARVWGWEALVRGPAGEGAHTVLSQVGPQDVYAFDQACRVKAIELAGARMPNDGSRLSINFKPNAVYEPRACIRATLDAAERVGFDPRRLMFEFTEDERIDDVAHLEKIVAEYRRMGFVTAIDDFGAGHAGLGLLARFQPDVLKLDMLLVRDIEASPAKQAIVAAVVGLARALEVEVLAEGVETAAEAIVLRAAGIRLMQGYHFARPALERFPLVGEAPHAALRGAA